MAKADYDALTIIQSEIEKIPGYKKATSTGFFVCCPFHDERTPSCHITTSTEGDVPLGIFHCFGCGEKGGWNKMANKVGLEEIENWKFFDSGVKSPISKNDELRLLGATNTSTHINTLIHSKESIPWPEEIEWRGYDGKILKAAGAVYYNDIRSDELMIGLPVTVNGKAVGAIKAFMEKKEKRMSYLTTEGAWVKSKGLFPYDLCKKLCKKRGLTFVVLVEGPRDALRLLKMGIPALACLGTNNITAKKLILAMSITENINKVWVMSDNDRAGTKMWLNIKDLSTGLVDTERLLLPRDKDKNGQLIKVDPDSCPSAYMNKVKRYLLR